MLKNNSSVSACSLSSCRLKAEALARALNSRIWPCTWVGGESSGDGMSAPDEEDDLYFDASPSPIEDEASIIRHPRDVDSSAATVAGRAKLYELLQQHVADDATEVFYDVSEDSTLTDQEHVVEMCRRDENIQCSNCQKNSNDDMDVSAVNVFNYNSENGLMSSEQLCHSENFCLGESHVEDATEGKSVSEVPKNKINHELEEMEEIEICKLDSVSFNNEDLDAFNIVKDETQKLDQNKFSDIQETDKNSNEISSTINIDIKTENFNSTENGENNDNECLLLNETLFNGRTEKRTSFPKTPFPKNISCKNLEDATDIDADELDVLNFSEGNGNFEDKSVNNENITELKTMISIEVTEDSSASSLTESESKNDSPISCCLHVFAEDRPMISRSTSLKTGKTPPGTPSRKKIVRFADVLGLDLEDVRHVMTSDVPTIPSSAYTDLVLSDDDKPIPANEVVVVQSTQNDSAFQSAAGSNSLYPMFSVPGLMSDFMERVRSQGICLDSVTVSDLSIQCTCRVMNWGYKKRVVARYTVNDWASSNDIDASYVAGSTQDDTDAFSFNIFLSPFHKNVKFALRFQVNGKEYWDNNRGDNYCLGYYGDGRSSPSSSSAWLHQFW